MSDIKIQKTNITEQNGNVIVEMLLADNSNLDAATETIQLKFPAPYKKSLDGVCVYVPTRIFARAMIDYAMVLKIPFQILVTHIII